MLLDFSPSNELDDSKTHVSIAACTADLESSSSPSVSERQSPGEASCWPDSVSRSTLTSYVELAISGSVSSTGAADVVDALKQLQAAFTISESGCLYVGSGLSSQGVISTVLDLLTTQVEAKGSISQEILVQKCDNLTARYSLGVLVSTKADLSSMQQPIQAWRNGSCVATMEESTPGGQLQSRDDSRERTTIQVESGDSCSTLATECSITGAKFEDYNPSSDLCSTLTAGRHVCCTSGTMPDYSLQPDSNGNCYSYTVQTGDSCSALAATYDISVDKIKDWNTGANGT
ncbi:hypothetical protein BDW59DRAFT_158337 [Aspergillus cavernicola]|uniref:LysM domain-containing protein n=1 Tax=Aspergillus cavernicola TaxID=176166 RepID=A0ABR4IT08_9EURO